MTFTDYKITLVFLIYQLWEVGFVTCLNGEQNSLKFEVKEWGFFGFFWSRVFTTKMFWLNTLFLRPGAVSIQTGQKQNSAILGAMDVLFTNGAHSNCISLTSVGIFG